MNDLSPEQKMQKQIDEIHKAVIKIDKRTALTSLSLKGAWVAIAGMAKAGWDYMSQGGI